MADNVSLIDLEQVVKAKAGKKAKYFPKFLIGWLKKFVHQDFLNEFLKHGYVGVEFCEKTIDYLGVTLQIEGLGNLPEMEDGDEAKRYTFVSNHPLGAIDGVTLCGVLGRKYNGQVTCLMNDFLMYLEGLRPFAVPINKTGSQSRDLPRKVNEAFGSRKQMLMFPAGKCSRKIDGKIQDVEWTKTFITKSIATRRDIVPIHFIGENSKRFYRIARICKFLRVKFNVAMMFLPDEMYRSRGNSYRVIIGKPIPYETFDKSRTHAEWAQWVREKVYEL